MATASTTATDCDLDGDPGDSSEYDECHPCDNNGITNTYQDNSQYYHNYACNHVWFEDPVGWHVNDVANEVQWNPTIGSCAYGAGTGPAYGSSIWYWLTATGWYVKGQPQFTTSYTCSGVTSTTTSTFENDKFCALQTTHTYYNGNSVTGDQYGGFQTGGTYNKDGGCNDWLSQHQFYFASS
ncbi:MAG: hypothetical protein LC808_39835 [Actinobacteria bacterium]|nr:hypothetical protein [Actinomycetota bacterium]